MELKTHSKHEHASTSLKALLLVFAIVLVGVLAYLVWMANTSPDTADYSSLALKRTDSQVGTCNFSTVTTTTVPGKTFNIFGEEAFSTLVCGYITPKDKNVSFGGTDIRKVAYLTVLKFQDEGHKKEVESGVAEGNGVNIKSGNNYSLGCGCLDNNKITAESASTTEFMSVADQAKFIASTATKPLIMKLTYNVHPGSGCTCCSLFEKAEIL